MTMWLQKKIQLAPRNRGFHLVTAEVIQHCPELNKINVGMMHLFICHTSASLTINENADASVRSDFEAFFNRLVPENEAYFRHTDEGSDDMPAHLKSSILSHSLSIPVTNGSLNMGVWQGIYLCEHRNYGGSRQLVMTIQGSE